MAAIGHKRTLEAHCRAVLPIGRVQSRVALGPMPRPCLSPSTIACANGVFVVLPAIPMKLLEPGSRSEPLKFLAGRVDVRLRGPKKCGFETADIARVRSEVEDHRRANAVTLEPNTSEI